MRSVLKSLWGALALCLAAIYVAGAAVAADQNGYANTALSLEGIGKSYMGREIAAVMGYQGAAWLERNTRVEEEGTDKLLPLLNLKPTDVVADIGAGTGYFSFRMSALVPQGKVYANDIQEEMLQLIAARKAKGEGANIVTVLGGVADPKLPADTIDLMLLVDVYHEFSYPREMGLAMAKALKPGGRIALVEYRGEDPSVPIKELHKMTEAQAKKEMAAVGLKWVSTDSTSLPWQHLMIFTK
jgi:ubiquinone/menaquinone biosynthesis C-methylase UbiE